MSGVEPRYRSDPFGADRSVELEGLSVLYHCASGLTHVLAPPSPQILDSLRDAELSLAELEARMSKRFELVGGAEMLAARLDELVGAGLVERL